MAITRAALQRDLPLLGICGGQQLLNVALGGDLIQHIPDAVPGLPGARAAQSAHRARPRASRCWPAAGCTRWAAPCSSRSTRAHHQAAGAVGDGVVVSGRAPDGVIEAIEVPGRRFCIGVQWHPEYRISAADDALFRRWSRRAADDRRVRRGRGDGGRGGCRAGRQAHRARRRLLAPRCRALDRRRTGRGRRRGADQPGADRDRGERRHGRRRGAARRRRRRGCSAITSRRGC